MKLQFKEITISSIQEMLPYYNMRHNRTCDSVFMESFIWKEYYHVRYAIWENKALLWLMENNGKCFSAMPLCREEDLPAAFQAIETYFNEELGYPLVINLADEFAVQYLNLPEDRYLVEEQVDSRDYLYSAEAMRTLAGKKLHKKKNRVNAFKREYEGRYEYRRLCCSDSHDVWVFLDRWRQQKGEDVEEHLDYEVRGIHDILKNCSDFYAIHMGGVYIDGQMEAFSIGSYNPVENMAVIHIEKANPEINGLYQYINQQFLLEEFPEVEWVNREDDMGLEGLRKAKLSYNPADYARKYLVEQLLDGKKGYHWAEQIGNTSQGSSIGFLSAEDKSETRRLWHSCFPEDSEEFIRYYYTEKTKDNRILVKKENGILISMTHLNPYPVRVKSGEWELDYLVAVSTEAGRRREGHLRTLFADLLKRQYEEEKPVTYLVPVNPAVYEPFGFTFIGNLPAWELRPEKQAGLTRVICRDLPEDCARAAEWMERWLSARYEMHTRRDGAYVSRLLKELKSENGTLEFLLDGGTLVGLEAFWGLEKRERRLLYADEAYTVKTGEKPWNMARLANLPALLGAFKLRDGDGEQGECCIRIRVSDPLIRENNGTFLWVIGGEKTELKPVNSDPEQADAAQPGQADGLAGQADAAKPGQTDGLTGQEDELPEQLECTPEQLVSWLFGYRPLSEIWPDLPDGLRRKLERVDLVKGVFLDEIV